MTEARHAKDTDGVVAGAEAWLSQRETVIETMLRSLVQVPSDNLPGDCAAHARTAAAMYEALGFDVAVHPVPADVLESAGLVSATNLIVRHRFGPGPTIAFNAHGDVVPPGEGWTTDPYGGEVRDGWLYGRGAAVSKSDFVTYGLALKALVESAAPLAGTVELHLTYDEETGGHAGPAWLLSQGLTRPDYAVCAAFSHAVVTAHNGCLQLEVRLAGRSAHAAWPETGADAVEAATTVAGALYGHRRTLAGRRSRYPGVDAPTLVIGTVAGGINTNVVADRASLRVDRRILPEEDPEAVEAELRAIVDEAASQCPVVDVDCRRLLLARPLVPLDGTEALAAVFCRHASDVLGEAVSTTALPLYTDARHYAEAGIPTVMYGAGPRDPLTANGHRADERVELASIGRAARVVVRTVAELLGERG